MVSCLSSQIQCHIRGVKSSVKYCKSNPVFAMENSIILNITLYKVRYHQRDFGYGVMFKYPVDNFGTVVGENPDCQLLSGTEVGENPDHVCWVVKSSVIFGESNPVSNIVSQIQYLLWRTPSFST